jgi:hypothetical protein
MVQPSLILELHGTVFDATSDIQDILRRSSDVAVKLGLPEFRDWINLELKGYPKGIEPPAYRTVATQVVTKSSVQGIQPVECVGGGRIPTHFASTVVRYSIGDIARLIENGKGGLIEAELSESELEALLIAGADFGTRRIVRIVNKNGLMEILDSVRNRILHWTLEMQQKGVFGYDMAFTQQECVAALTANTPHLGSPAIAETGSSTNRIRKDITTVVVPPDGPAEPTPS